MSCLTQAYIISDLDGCLALNEHRAYLVPQGDDRESEEAWRTYVMNCGEDTLNPFVAQFITDFYVRGHAIHYCTGRMEYSRQVTWTWLRRMDVPMGIVTHRPNGDTRPNWQLKEEMLDTLARSYGALPVLAIEDDPATVAMYQHHGVNVLSVATRSSCLAI